MNCKVCKHPLEPARLWGSWHCVSEHCPLYHRRLFPKPAQREFHPGSIRNRFANTRRG